MREQLPQPAQFAAAAPARLGVSGFECDHRAMLLPAGKRWKLGLLLAVGLTALSVPGSAVAAAGSCSGTGTTLQVKAPPPVVIVTLSVSNSVIMYQEDSNAAIPCTLGDSLATTTTTDTI